MKLLANRIALLKIEEKKVRELPLLRADRLKVRYCLTVVLVEKGEVARIRSASVAEGCWLELS